MESSIHLNNLCSQSSTERGKGLSLLAPDLTENLGILGWIGDYIDFQKSNKMISFLSCSNTYYSKFSQEMVLKSQQIDIYRFLINLH